MCQHWFQGDSRSEVAVLRKGSDSFLQEHWNYHVIIWAFTRRNRKIIISHFYISKTEHMIISARWHWSRTSSVYLMMLSQLYRLYSVKWEGDCRWWTGKNIIGNGCSLLQNIIPAFSLKAWRKSWKTSVKIVTSGWKSNLGPSECKVRVVMTQL